MPDTPDRAHPVRVRLDDAVLHITLDTPDNGNLVSASMGAAVIEAMRGLDPQVRLVVLRGAGADFCAGRMSPTPAKGAPPPSGERLRELVAQPALDLYDAIKASPVPTLAIVQGRAIGVGTALAAVCDLALAADDSVFQVPEMERDIPPTLVMSALCDRVPLKSLAWLVLSRRAWSGREAQAGGLVSWTVPAAQLEQEASAVIATLSACSPVALRACKQYLAHAPAMNPQAASAFASHLCATALSARY